MPVSKNRKNHVQKAKYRNTKLKEQKNRIDSMYNSMLAELRDKNTSMTEMLNKEDSQQLESTEPNYLSYPEDIDAKSLQNQYMSTNIY